jgi:hypothetical protein
MLATTVLSAALAAPACGQQIGAAGIGPSYQFTNAPPTCEEAQVMAAMHAPVHKFRLAPPYGTTLLQFWQTDPATVCIASLPFRSLVFWATPILPPNVYGPNIANPAYYEQNYNELYALAVWLRTAYVGTGRSFYMGNWETDNLNGGIGVTPSQTTFQNEIGWFNIRQKAINDAIAATPTSDVKVYHYVEVNAVQTAMAGSGRVVNSVVPYLNPMADFVSYSSYDSLYPNASTLLPPALAYIQKQIPLRPDGSPSVFIGEYGFKASYWGPQGQAAQSQKVIAIAQMAKLPMTLYWAVYDNTGYGYWLVNTNDVEQPVYFVLQSAVTP